MLTHIKSACIHSTDGVAGDRALSASGTAPSRQGQALSLDVQNDSSVAVLFSAPRPLRVHIAGGYRVDSDPMEMSRKRII